MYFVSAQLKSQINSHWHAFNVAGTYNYTSIKVYISYWIPILKFIFVGDLQNIQWQSSFIMTNKYYFYY